MHSTSFSGVSFTRPWQACSEGAVSVMLEPDGSCALAINPGCGWAKRDGRRTQTATVMQATHKPRHFSLGDSDSNIGTPLSSPASLHHPSLAWLSLATISENLHRTSQTN